METLLQDLRFGLRLLRKGPGFTLAAVSALALGIAASTSIFSVLYGVALRPLPFRDADQLVNIVRTRSDGGRMPLSGAEYVELAKEVPSFSQTVAMGFAQVTRTGGGDPEQLSAVRLTPEGAGMLAVPMAAGRMLGESDRSGAPAVVLSERVAKKKFGSAQAALGKQLVLQGLSHTVVGVTPAYFQIPILEGASLLLPLILTPEQAQDRGQHFLAVFGRLRKGVTPEQLAADLKVQASRFGERDPEARAAGLRARPLKQVAAGGASQPLFALLVASLVLLAIGCTNVAALLLARGTARAREITIRATLGGSRGRLSRQLITEAALLGLMGGAVGAVAAVWAVDLLVALAPPGLPRLGEVRLDGPALLFAVALALLSGLLAGALPAIKATRLDLASALRSMAHQSTSRSKARKFLVACEVALSLLLLSLAAVVGRSLLQTLRTPPGLRADGALVTEISRPARTDAEAAEASRLFSLLRQRLAAAPGFESVTASSAKPYSPEVGMVDVKPEGAAWPTTGEHPITSFQIILPDFFRTLGVPLLTGREFTDADDAKAPKVVLVNETFVKRYLPGQDPVGARLTVGLDDGVWTIVGVTRDVRFKSLDEAPQPELYAPMAQFNVARAVFVVRTNLSPVAAAARIRSELRELDSGLPLTPLQPLADLLRSTSAQKKFILLLLSVFAAIALALAAVGIYGLMAYSVQLTRREVGLRMALGAHPRQVLRGVLSEGLGVTAAGLVAGILLSLTLGRLLRALVPNLPNADPASILITSAGLALVAMAACFGPARRATRLDPALILRTE